MSKSHLPLILGRLLCIVATLHKMNRAWRLIAVTICELTFGGGAGRRRSFLSSVILQ